MCLAKLHRLAGWPDNSQTALQIQGFLPKLLVAEDTQRWLPVKYYMHSSEKDAAEDKGTANLPSSESDVE